MKLSFRVSVIVLALLLILPSAIMGGGKTESGASAAGSTKQAGPLKIRGMANQYKYAPPKDSEFWKAQPAYNPAQIFSSANRCYQEDVISEATFKLIEGHEGTAWDTIPISHAGRRMQLTKTMVVPCRGTRFCEGRPWRPGNDGPVVQHRHQSGTQSRYAF